MPTILDAGGAGDPVEGAYAILGINARKSLGAACRAAISMVLAVTMSLP
jgi:hypothetical protein